jgi:hypothetical protein
MLRGSTRRSRAAASLGAQRPYRTYRFCHAWENAFWELRFAGTRVDRVVGKESAQTLL